MRITPCDCGVDNLVRMNRSWWMRLAPGRRHYWCISCGEFQLLSRRGLRRAFPELAPALDRDRTGPAPLGDDGASPWRPRSR